MGRETKEFHAAYIKWAETFVFQRGSAGSDALYNLLRIRRHIFNFIFPH
jgi:hypothetical protein